MSEPIVSVIIPTYHRPDRISRAVDSALQQTVPTQVIVVDDNGKGTKEQSNTEGALSSYIQNNQIIYLINEVNSRAPAARNHGIEYATCSFITFLDDDDEINPAKLEKQVNRLNELGEEYVACYTAYHRISSNGKIMKSREIAEGYVYPWALERGILLGSGSNLLCRTETVKKIHGYDPNFKKQRDDQEFFARITELGKIAYVNEDLLTIHYEIRENPLTYEDLSDSDDLYLRKFQSKINSLPEYQRNGIYETIALERWKYSLPRHQKKNAELNMKKYHVRYRTWFRFICYLMKRVITNTSYGFKNFKL